MPSTTARCFSQWAWADGAMGEIAQLSGLLDQHNDSCLCTVKPFSPRQDPWQSSSLAGHVARAQHPLCLAAAGARVFSHSAARKVRPGFLE